MTDSAAADMRELHFTFEIVTDLGEGDEVAPSVKYVADWLNDNGYGYVQIDRPYIKGQRCSCRSAPSGNQCAGTATGTDDLCDYCRTEPACIEARNV